jgi:hypothetical protein
MRAFGLFAVLTALATAASAASVGITPRCDSELECGLPGFSIDSVPDIADVNVLPTRTLKEENLTNGQRLARGLPLKAPKRTLF